VLRQVSSGPAAELRRRALVVAGVRTTRAMRRCIGAPVGPARAAALEHERVRYTAQRRGCGGEGAVGENDVDQRCVVSPQILYPAGG
jgi:hypothetical protein